MMLKRDGKIEGLFLFLAPSSLEAMLGLNSLCWVTDCDGVRGDGKAMEDSQYTCSAQRVAHVARYPGLGS